MAINFPDSPSVNDVFTSSSRQWKWDGESWQSIRAGEGGLPSQTGQAGEFLQTDGTTMTWEPAGGGYDVASTSTGYFDLPSGTTAQRPGSPATGNIRFNETETSLEHYADGTWIGFAGSVPTISSIAPTTAAEPGTTIQVTGTNFQAGAIISFIGTNLVSINASSTTVDSAVQITCTTPATLTVANEPYDVKITNTNGGSATLVNVLDAGGTPTWTTAAGNLGTLVENVTGNHFTLVATDPDGQAVTFAETTSVLTGAGLTLNSTTGVISGDPTDVTSVTTYAFDVDASDGVNNTSRSFTIIVQDPAFTGATGGTETTYSSGGVNYKIHAFLTTATFNAGTGGDADILLVGGGGAAGWAYVGWWGAGGGGAGGLIYKPNHTFAASETALCTIGAGGAGAGSNGQPQANKGLDTTVGSLFTAKGGGAGNNDGGQATNDLTGGSGGGSTYTGQVGGTALQPSQAGDSGTYGFGNNGGSTTSASSVGGGGGGAGAVGAPWDNSSGGDGGIGKDYSTIFDTTYGDSGWFAGGGGGGCYNTNHSTTGGQGGGGDNVGSSPGAGNPGMANTGGGGGANFTTAPTGSGGTGIVLIRYVLQ